MTNAIELRLDPTAKCKWTPLLKKDAPALCGEGSTSSVVFSENFDSGLGAWSKGEVIDKTGSMNLPWRSSAVYPGRENVGRVAYGPDPDAGDCATKAPDNLSSSDSITSPPVLVPAGKAMRLSFDHYVATESKFDGGNVKLSINGGAFAVIPNAAYVFNAPNITLDPAVLAGQPNNTSPLAGQPGFSGTNPGRASGSWGTSQVNLEAAGVKAGDNVQIRFDMGRDGCGGVDGWYVDNVSVTVCEDTNTAVAATHVPEPSEFGTASRVDVSVSAANGGVPTGTVDVLKADGSKIGSGTLAGGKASVALPADLPVGTHVLSVTYSGKGGFKPSTGSVTVTVKKTVAPTPGKGDSVDQGQGLAEAPSFGNDFTVIGKVKAEGLAQRSRVVFKIDGKRIGSRKISEGRAVMTVRSN